MAKSAIRRHNRLVHGMRRIKEDRAQHGEDHSCPCFNTAGSGYTFSMFADTPTRCSNPECCGNPRRSSWGGQTIQERKAPKTSDWD